MEVALFLRDVRFFASSILKGETSMKRFVMAIVLNCAAISIAAAGDVPSVGITAPTPNGTIQVTATAPGDIPTVGSSVSISESLMSIIQLLGGLGV
jgi:hypothetical protein